MIDMTHVTPKKNTAIEYMRYILPQEAPDKRDGIIRMLDELHHIFSYTYKDDYDYHMDKIEWDDIDCIQNKDCTCFECINAIAHALYNELSRDELRSLLAELN